MKTQQSFRWSDFAREMPELAEMTKSTLRTTPTEVTLDVLQKIRPGATTTERKTIDDLIEQLKSAVMVTSAAPTNAVAGSAAGVKAGSTTLRKLSDLPDGTHPLELRVTGGSISLGDISGKIVKTCDDTKLILTAGGREFKMSIYWGKDYVAYDVRQFGTQTRDNFDVLAEVVDGALRLEVQQKRETMSEQSGYVLKTEARTLKGTLI